MFVIADGSVLIGIALTKRLGNTIALFSLAPSLTVFD